MLWTVAKTTGRPLHPSVQNPWDAPYTIMHVIALRIKYDSYLELSDPVPEHLWDYPQYVRQHIEKLYPSVKKTAVDVSSAEVEQ